MKERSEKLVKHNVAHVLKISCLEDDKAAMKINMIMLQSRLDVTTESESKMKKDFKECKSEMSDWKMKFKLTDKMFN